MPPVGFSWQLTDTPPQSRSLNTVSPTPVETQMVPGDVVSAAIHPAVMSKLPDEAVQTASKATAEGSTAPGFAERHSSPLLLSNTYSTSAVAPPGPKSALGASSGPAGG